ncbi:MAG: LysM peptidoglycan-binding domain-containing protein [Sulfuricella sp.]|nr:LysM peptidoglycan-binding domain-containing protein [Sulfuricella sp.]
MRIQHAVSVALSVISLFHTTAWSAEQAEGGKVPAIKQAYAETAEPGLAPLLQLSPKITSVGDEEPVAETEAPVVLQNSGDLWERIRNGFVLAEMDTPLIQDHESWYANRPDYVERMVERSQRYLYHIVEEVEKRGMPTEVALLPMIESAFNPKAYSRAHASGIWQFIPSTGKNFGLQQNWWYDGRRDIMAATNAALDYLQKLYGMFGSWELALAAYNWGEGNVMRAIARNEAKGLPTDFLSLRMPPETRNYLPKLLAVKHIVANPQAYGLSLASIPNQPYFIKVSTGKHIDMALAARLAEIPAAEFASLNPAHNRPVINNKDSSYLLLPADKADTFMSNLESYDKPLVSWQSYKLSRGERLDAVARKFSINVARLKEINGISTQRKLAGGTLLVPKGSSAVSDQGSLTADYSVEVEPEAPASTTRRTAHVVKKGDTLLSVARRYGVTPAQLKVQNHLKANQLALGQKLTIVKEVPNRKMLATKEVPARKSQVAAKQAAKPLKSKQVSAAKQRPAQTHYTVRHGDTLSSIARRFNVAANDIQRWNNISAKRPLNPGLKVTLLLPRT